MYILYVCVVQHPIIVLFHDYIFETGKYEGFLLYKDHAISNNSFKKKTYQLDKLRAHVVLARG